MTSQMYRNTFAAALILLGPADVALSQAQGDGFGGSFEPDAPPPAVQPAPAAPPSGGVDFGGSFDDATVPPPPVAGGPSPPPPAPPPAEAAAPAVIGGGDFDNGSFDDPQPQIPQPGLPAAVPDPAPQPPQAPVAPAQPPAQAPAQAGVQVPDQVTQLELQDYGLPPTSTLRDGQFHAATPTMIPGAQVVTTKSLADAMNAGTRMVLIDVLGGQYSLPGAVMAPALAQPGSFGDRLQQQAAQWLGQVSAGDASIPIVIYCSDPMCWLSYNAALRTVAAGYGNVYWYRGGLHAWQMSGFPLQPSSF